MNTSAQQIEEEARPSLDKDGFFFTPAFLLLEDGQVYEGMAPAWQNGTFDGEVVFTTGMTGYEEALTDPSYAGQILAFTYPLIGNYGIPPKEKWESHRIHAAGVVVNEACRHWSHGKSEQSLLEWLASQQVPAIMGIDTRSLAKSLREKGTMLGAISSSSQPPTPLTDPNQTLPAAKVSIEAPIVYGSGKKRIIAIDCGMKLNIVRNLQKHAIEILRVPYNFDYTSEEFDGAFLSNGPGNPTMYTETIAILRKAMEKKKPIFGICLGAQLIALAAGARTYKMRYGHRGLNQPCIETASGRCMITSQNHGYAIDEESLPEGWTVSFRNLNDGTVEGIAHSSLPFSAVQFHPESSPGPTDTEWLFEQFIGML